MTAQRITISGAGAVSPAGWSAGDLAEAVLAGRSFAPEDRERLANVLPVPKPDQPPLRHPRLRRVSPVTRFAVAAALEALGEKRDRDWRLGIIANVVNGCVTYTRRFYGEVLEDPASASPILFPETVFNSPASHIGAVLGATSISYTLLGDSTQFLSGVDLAASWLVTNQVDACLVLSCEELDWITTEGIRMFEPNAVVSEGAGALLLERDSDAGIELAQVTETFAYSNALSREFAIEAMNQQLLSDGPNVFTADEARIRPTLGFGLTATAWQAVLAYQTLLSGEFDEAIVPGVGTDQQAIGARFRRSQ